MLNALIVVFRESLEAMLVIGVLLAWIARQPEPTVLRRGLWLGVAAGIGLALALGLATFAAQSQLSGEALEKFQVGMVLFAAGLIVQMVFWMHRHGRHMKRELEAQAGRVVGAGALGIGAVTALAVAREGAETVVFLYGLGLESNGDGRLALLAAALAGFALAATTGWLVARGGRFLSYRTLFAASEILLLVIASSLLMAGVDRMIGLDWLPPLLDPVWDSSALLDDGHGAGRLLADFAGYRARPSASLLLAYAAFWSYAIWRLRHSSKPVS